MNSTRPEKFLLLRVLSTVYVTLKGFLLDVHISLFLRSLSRTSLGEGMCNPSSLRGSMPSVYTTFNKIKILLTVDIISLRVDGILFEVLGRVA